MHTEKVNRLGFYFAILWALLNLWFYIAIVPAQPTLFAPWPGLSAYAASFLPLPFLAWIVPAFLLAPTILIVMICLHAWSRSDRKMWSLLALIFAALYMAILTPFYYIQMTVACYHLVNGTADGLTLWLYGYDYPYNIPGALEAVGYGFVSAGYIFVSQVFAGGRLLQWLRWTFLGLGLTGLPVFIDPLVRLPPAFLLPDAFANALLGTLAPVLLAVYLRRDWSEKVLNQST